jgi:hypothetical protein
MRLNMLLAKFQCPYYDVQVSGTYLPIALRGSVLRILFVGKEPLEVSIGNVYNLR